MAFLLLHNYTDFIGHHVSGAEFDKKNEYEGICQKSVPTIEKKGARDIIGSTKKNYDN